MRVTGTTAVEVEDDTNWMSEGDALPVDDGEFEGPAFYTEGEFVGGGGLTVGGPAVATTGEEEEEAGEERGEDPGPAPPEPECVPSL